MIHLTLEYLFMAGTISAYIYYIFRLTACFVKKKQGILWNIAAFIGIWLTGDMVVFPEDPINIAAMLLLYTATVFLFYGGNQYRKNIRSADFIPYHGFREFYHYGSDRFDLFPPYARRIFS